MVQDQKKLYTKQSFTPLLFATHPFFTASNVHFLNFCERSRVHKLKFCWTITSSIPYSSKVVPALSGKAVFWGTEN